MVAIEQRFLDFWTKTHSKQHAPWAWVVSLYSEPHRKYHTLHHIRQMLDELDNVPTHSVTLEAAVWFHDIYYGKRLFPDEKASAYVAGALLRASAVDVRRLRRLILLTEHHQPSDDYDEKLMVDLDLSILGKEVGTFETYDRAIRHEYVQGLGYAEEQFREGRRKFLEGLLARKRIFHILPFTEREEQARTNISYVLPLYS